MNDVSIEEFNEAWLEWYDRHYGHNEYTEMDEYHNRPIDLMCHQCGARDLGTEFALREKGWVIIPTGIYCPSH